MAIPYGVDVTIKLDHSEHVALDVYGNIRYNKGLGGVYFPGEKVSGYLQVTRNPNSADIHNANVLMSFKGRADVHIVTNTQWVVIPKNSYIRDSGENINYEGYTVIKPYFDEERVPIAKNVKIPIGITKYQFSFPLHEDGIAASFCGQHGDIIYGIEGRLEVWGFADIVVSLPFLVIGNLDLSDMDDYNWSLPITTEEDRWVGMKCLKNGPLSIQIKLPQGGFIPGEEIRAILKIDNKSRRTVRQIRAEFVQRVEYICGHVSEREATSYRQVTLSGFPKKHQEEREVSLFSVPHIQPTLSWGVIRIQYTLHFEVDITCSKNLKLECPIVIGSHRSARDQKNN